jgi:hypothetical protein
MQDELTIIVTPIGSIDKGCDGREEYVLLTCHEDNITEDDAYNYIMPRVYCDTNRVGGYFCKLVETIQKTDNQVICIIHHQYDN